jgi:uncharacterized phage-associated protein
LAERDNSKALSDQITLLVLLKVLNDLGFETRRLKLEKLVYFANVLGKILGEKITNHEFFVWKYGPFSKQLYADVEVLVSHRLANAVELETYDEADEKSFEYSITPAGIAAVETALRESEFEAKYDVILSSLQATGGLSTGQIKKLAYGELDFNEARARGWKTIINPEFPVSVRMTSLAKEVAERDFGMKLSNEEAAVLYLNLVEALASK